MVTVTKTCTWCGNAAVVEVDEVGYVKWKAGEFVQRAFPDMDIPTREMLISGTHPKCWDDMFPEM